MNLIPDPIYASTQAGNDVALAAECYPKVREMNVHTGAVLALNALLGTLPGKTEEQELFLREIREVHVALANDIAEDLTH